MSRIGHLQYSRFMNQHRGRVALLITQLAMGDSSIGKNGIAVLGCSAGLAQAKG